MDMDDSLEPVLEEMKQEIDKWIAYINDKDAEKIIKRTTLQMGIHGYALLKYEGGRVDVTDYPLDLSVQGKSRLSTSGGLTEEQVREQIVPELAHYMQHKLNELPPAVLDYRFNFEGTSSRKRRHCQSAYSQICGRGEEAAAAGPDRLLYLQQA